MIGQKSINTAIIESPVGPLLAGVSSNGIVGLYYHGIHRGQPERTKAWPHVDVDVDDNRLNRLRTQLGEFFAGRRKQFDLELDLRGTEFYRRVWSELRKIPYGKTMSYRELASRVGSPGAVRAVGAANARNPVSIIVPCHRVIASNGKLTGYAGGLENKRHLLEREGALERELL